MFQAKSSSWSPAESKAGNCTNGFAGFRCRERVHGEVQGAGQSVWDQLRPIKELAVDETWSQKRHEYVTVRVDRNGGLKMTNCFYRNCDRWTCGNRTSGRWRAATETGLDSERRSCSTEAGCRCYRPECAQDAPHGSPKPHLSTPAVIL